MCLLPAPAVGVLVCETITYSTILHNTIERVCACTNLVNFVLSSLCRFCSLRKHHSESCVCQEWAGLVAVTNTHTVNISICSTTLVLPFVHFLSFPLAPSSLFVLPPLAQALPPLPSPPLPHPTPPLRSHMNTAPRHCFPL